MTRIACRSFGLSPLAVAAALALTVALPARAQFYSYSGAVGTFPTQFFPIDTSASLFDFSGNTLSIGNSAAGSFSAMAGALLRGNSVRIGDGPNGSGAFTVTGAGTRAEFSGAQGVNRLEIGSWGTGSMTVSAGALVDATVNAGACSAPGAFCYSFIGNAAGSTAALTVTGAGSEVRTLRSFIVGGVSVFTPETSPFTFGTPGGTTTASVNVLNGGTLRTQAAQIGVAPGGSAPLGTERSLASVVIDGAGSQWVVTHNSVDNREAFVTVANSATAQATIDIRNGGKMIIDGSGRTNVANDGINLGVNGGRAALYVSGVGSSLEVKGNSPVIQVGRSGVGAEGSLSVSAGATVSSLFLNVGRDGAVGAVEIDGAGSQMNLVGVGSGAAFANIGRAGSGLMTVSNGGRLFISDGGADSRAGTGSPGLIVGRDGVNGHGTLSIFGAGSVIDIVSSSLGLPAGSVDNFNPFVGVGYDTGSTGELHISNGGKLLMTGHALSSPGVDRVTNLSIGGRSATQGGDGYVSVFGAGSEIRVGGQNAFIGVGRGPGSYGGLDILNHGGVFSTSMLIGESGGTGVVTVDNARVALSGFRSDSSNVGAGMTVGRGVGGNGTLTLKNGAQFTIENNTLAGGMSIGGDQFVSGGTGAVSLTGGSSITFTGSVTGGALTVGRSGSGTLALDGASTVDVGNTRSVFVGRNAGGVGSLVVGGGSTVRGGSIGIGGDSDSVAGGSGSAVVSGAGSRLVASGDSGFIGVGRSGTGSLVVANQGAVDGIVLNVGRASGGVGTLAVDNGVINLSGQQSTGIGAALSIGNRGGSGVASIGNGSVVTITNLGSGGASLNVGGTPVNPLGTGTLSVANSQINMITAPGQATVRIGHDGTGTATFTASSLNIGDGSLIIAGTPGSVGTLTLNAGTVVNTGYVGVGASPAGPGGQGTLIMNNSIVNTTTFEIGALGVLSGDGGVINASGDVIVAGTISPGNSPGRININCNVITIAGSRLILDIQSTGTGYDVDHIILGTDSTFDLSKVQVVFNFLANTDPTAFAASGGFDLDNFLNSGDIDTGLSTVFGPDQTWANVIDSSLIKTVSSAFEISNLQLRSDGSIAVTAVAVPEPETWALLLIGLAVVGAVARRRQHRVNGVGAE